MKKRARIVSGLVALAAFFLAPLAEASLTRATSPAMDLRAPTLTLASPEPSEFSLFEGAELTPAATESERAPRFHPLAAVSLLSEDGAEAPLVSAEELSYPKTRYRVFELLGTPIVGVERGVSLELHWGCASFSCGLASGTVGWLSQDPLGDKDSVNLYGFVGGRPHEKTDPMGTCAGLDNVPCGDYAFSIVDQFLNPTNDWGNVKRSASFAGSMLKGAALAVPRFVMSLPSTVKTAAAMSNAMMDLATNPVLTYNVASVLVKNRDAVSTAAAGVYRQAGNAALSADSAKVGEFAGEQLFWAGTAGFGATEEGAALIGRIGAALRARNAWPSIVPEGGWAFDTPAVEPSLPRAYSTAFELELQPKDFGLSRKRHITVGRNALLADMAADPDYATLMNQTLATESAWTWEHASSSAAQGRSGVLRLVPRGQHTPGSLWWRLLHPDKGARGGYAEWAIPAGAPPNR